MSSKIDLFLLIISKKWHKRDIIMIITKKIVFVGEKGSNGR